MQIFGVSLVSAVDNRSFREKANYPFELLSDQDCKMSLAFGAIGSLNDEYVARYTFVVGANSKIEQAIATKNLRGQAQALLDSFT